MEPAQPREETEPGPQPAPVLRSGEAHRQGLLPEGATVLATTTRRCTMQAELVECWLCEETIVPDGARIRYRDKRGRVHPWPDRRGRWRPEYICRACMLVYPDCMEYDWSGGPFLPFWLKPVSGAASAVTLPEG
jgi:hypothetical protein